MEVWTVECGTVEYGRWSRDSGSMGGRMGRWSMDDGVGTVVVWTVVVWVVVLDGGSMDVGVWDGGEYGEYGTVHSMDKREKSVYFTKIEFSGLKPAKNSKTRLKKCFYLWKKYTDLKNLEFRRNFLIFR